MKISTIIATVDEKRPNQFDKDMSKHYESKQRNCVYNV